MGKLFDYQWVLDRLNISQIDLAKFLDLSPSMISHAVAGRVDFSDKALVDFAILLKLMEPAYSTKEMMNVSNTSERVALKAELNKRNKEILKTIRQQEELLKQMRLDYEASRSSLSLIITMQKADSDLKKDHRNWLKNMEWKQRKYMERCSLSAQNRLELYIEKCKLEVKFNKDKVAKL